MRVSSQQARSRVRGVTVTMLSLVLAIGTLGGTISRANATARDRAPAVAATFAPIAPPSLSAKAAFAFDATASTPLFAQAPDEHLPPASLTKIATALVVLDHADLAEKVTIEQADLVPPDQSQVGLVAGDTLSVGDLLIGLLVPSGNDAGLALARYVGQKLDPGAAGADQAVAAFVGAMNQKAASLGATNTHFTNPSGIDAPNHYSSARDLALMTAAGLENPVFRKTIATPSAVLASKVRPDGYPVATTDDLLVDGTVSGGKTGTTGEAGGCLMSTVHIGANDIVVVLLGSALDQTDDGALHSAARYSDMRALIDALHADFHWVDPTTPDAFPGLADELNVWGAYLPETSDVAIPQSRAAEARYRLVLGPAAAANAPVGSVLFFVGSDLLTERPILQVG